MTTQSVALVAHDRMKPALIQWAERNKPLLSEHTLYATGTTGMLVEEKLNLSYLLHITG